MFSSQLRSSLAAQQSSAKLIADGTDQQRLEALTSFGFGLRPVEELLVTAESDRRKVWTPSERARVLATLEKLSYIREAEVPRDALMECLDKIKLKSLVQDEYVFSQGDLNRSFYIVLSGQIHFCEPANKVRPAALGSSGPAPLDGLSASLCLSSPPSPPLCLRLLTAALGAFAHSALGEFTHSPSTHAHALARCAHCTALHARTEWTRRCGVAWQGTKLLGVAREGDGFGELGFITGKPRPVGARAATHCHLLVFDGELFSLLFSSVPERKVARCPVAPRAAAGGAPCWWLRPGGWARAGVVLVAGHWCGRLSAPSPLLALRRRRHWWRSCGRCPRCAG